MSAPVIFDRDEAVIVSRHFGYALKAEAPAHWAFVGLQSHLQCTRSVTLPVSAVAVS